MGKTAASRLRDTSAARGASSDEAVREAAPVPAKDDFLTIIISHGNFAVELKDALEHLMGPQPLVAALDIMANEPLAHTRRRLRGLLRDLRRQAVIARTDAADTLVKGKDTAGEGMAVVFLSDLFGGTPANLAHAEMQRNAPAWLLTGANLPMLVRLMELRGTAPVAAVVEEAAAAGRRFIRVKSNPA